MRRRKRNKEKKRKTKEDRRKLEGNSNKIEHLKLRKNAQDLNSMWQMISERIKDLERERESEREREEKGERKKRNKPSLFHLNNK